MHESTKRALDFHLDLFKHLPIIVFTSTRLTLAIPVVLAALAAFFSPELAALVNERFRAGATGFSRWWAAVPIGFLALLGILKANYARFTCLEGALARVNARRDELEERLKPKLEITFGGDVKPYLHEHHTTDANGNRWTQRRYRIGIKNNSDTVITHARVIVEDCDPGTADAIYLAHRLQVMDHVIHPGYFDVSPNEEKPTVYVDVVAELYPDANGSTDSILVCYVAAVPTNALPCGRYRFTLLVEGGGTYDRKHFDVIKDSPNSPWWK